MPRVGAVEGQGDKDALKLTLMTGAQLREYKPLSCTFSFFFFFLSCILSMGALYGIRIYFIKHVIF